MCVAGHDGYFKKVNRSFVETLGYTEVELTSRPYAEFVHPEDLGKTADEARQLQDGSGSIVFENRYFCKDGSICWLSWKCTNIGSLIYAVARNITPIKEAELAFSDVEKRLKLVLENAPITLVVLDAQGNFELSTGKGLTMLGRQQNDNRGKNIFSLYGSRPDICEPVRIALGGQSNYARIVFNNSDYDIFYEPVFDENHEVRQVIGISIDVTPQRKLEEEWRNLQLANSMPQIVWAARPDGQIDYHNDRWYEFTGFERSLAFDVQRELILHPEDLPVWRDTWAEAVKSGRPYETEYRFKNKNTGEYHWFLGRAIPVKNKLGEIIRWYGTCTDIHDQKTAAEQREKILTKLEKALKETSDIKFALDQSSIIATIDALGNFLFVNSKFCEISGYSENEILGQAYLEWSAQYHPKAFLDNLWTTISSGKVWSGEIKNRSKSGKEYWALTFIVPILGDGGEPYQYIAILTDVSDRKAAEEKLKAEQALFETTLQQMPVAVVIAEAPTGKLVFANKKIEEIFKFPMLYSESIDEYSAWKGFHPDGRPYEPQDWPMTRAITAHEVTSGEDVVIHRGDGTEGLVRLSAAPIKNHLGQTIAGVSIVEDRTEIAMFEKKHSQLLLSEQAAREASRLKSQFLANMSHEIRTPLNGVIGMASLLLETKLTAFQREYAETIVQSSRHLQCLVHDILDLSKIEANRLEMEISEVGLKPLMSNIYNAMKHFAAEREIKFVKKMSVEEDIQFYGDFTRIRQVLLNLAQNAIKFTEKGKVELRVAASNLPKNILNIRFEVEDTGIGIHPDELKSIFDPFVQADDKITRRFGGTGLGLSICKKLAHLMGGEVGVQSQLGKGSTFYFEIQVKPCPRAKISKLGKVVPTMTSRIAKSRRPLRILVAEDNPTNQRVIGRMLDKFGHQVSFVPDGVAAVSFAKKNKFDLILMDFHMPRLDGFSAAQQIRKSSGPERIIPIIALTADVLKETQEKCRAVGMNGFVSKPIDHEQLFSEIERLFDKKKKRNIKVKRIKAIIDLQAIQRLDVLSKPGDASFGMEIVSNFLDKTPQKIKEIDQALRDGNLVKVFNGAHSLKSVAAAVGARQVETYSAELERSARNNLLDESHKYFGRLTKVYRKAEQCLLDLQKIRGKKGKIVA